MIEGCMDGWMFGSRGWLQPPLQYITGKVRKLDALCLMPHTPRGIVTWSDGLCLMRSATPWPVICERSNGNL